MTHTITLSGWGQPADSLENIAPGATHIDYKDMRSIDELFAHLRGKECDTLIGWSLGGQLALRAIDAGVLTPRQLVLLATPFQFIMGRGLKCGIDTDSFNVFENNFRKDPQQSLKDFARLIARNDTYAKRIISSLQAKRVENPDAWLHWLDHLRHFSCQLLDLTRMPTTLAIVGREDSVVDPTQADLFRPFCADFRLVTLPNCGHAPHLHDPDAVKESITSALCPS